MFNFNFNIIKKTETHYLTITLSDAQLSNISLFEIELSDLRKNHEEKCQTIIDALSNNNTCQNTYIHVCSPDYGAHFYIGMISEGGKRYFVSCESFKNENDTTFKIKIPIDMCDQNSLINIMGKIKELIIDCATMNICGDIANNNN
ncbi:putative orfan [Tupanvirus soda lake]|uniref:Orfan n=2 Tax=Tupanvirus TaxID=2094720 RepID=A0AC62AD22_9VIRU|nr:putative orfan [Tupanvirus soda lake]QKU35691.1 putative orfan [Tupanvirus soda lake]